VCGQRQLFVRCGRGERADHGALVGASAGSLADATSAACFRVIRWLLVHAVDERELDIVDHLGEHLSGLPVQLVTHRVHTSDVRSGELADRCELRIRHTNGFLVDLGDVRQVGTDTVIRGGSVSAFERCALSGVTKIERLPFELGGDRLPATGETTDRGEKRCVSRRERVQDTGVVGEVVGGAQGGDTGHCEAPLWLWPAGQFLVL